jgi:hypothetical protein
MSILKSYYEISVWKDVSQNGTITESKICVIGSSDMEY